MYSARFTVNAIHVHPATNVGFRFARLAHRGLSTSLHIIHCCTTRSLSRTIAEAQFTAEEQEVLVTDTSTDGSSMMHCNKVVDVWNLISLDCATLPLEVAGAQCIKITKYAEGAYNRIYLLSFEDGQEVIARLPLRMADPPHLLTCSEAATMDFLRSRLGFPIPKVLAWSSNAADSPVGSEYIIMEKAEGVHVEDRLMALDTDELTSITGNVTKLGIDMASIQFSQIGSLLYKEHVSEELRDRPLYAEGVPDDECADRFRVGPSIDRNFYRGSDTLSYFKAIAEREANWFTTYGDSPEGRLQCGARVSPEVHIELLRKWLTIAPHAIPLHPNIGSFTLWHPDLHGYNLLISSDSSKIEAVLDWQGSCILPLYAHAEPPPFLAVKQNCLKHFELPPGLAFPPQPEGFNDLVGADKTAALHEEALIIRHKMYIQHISKANRTLYGLFGSPKSAILKLPILNSGLSWWRGISALCINLFELYHEWESLYIPAGHTGDCPIFFSRDELEIYEKQIRIHLYDTLLVERVHAEFDAMGIKVVRDGEILASDCLEATNAHSVIFQKISDEKNTDAEREKVR